MQWKRGFKPARGSSLLATVAWSDISSDYAGEDEWKRNVLVDSVRSAPYNGLFGIAWFSIKGVVGRIGLRTKVSYT